MMKRKEIAFHAAKTNESVGNKKAIVLFMVYWGIALGVIFASPTEISNVPKVLIFIGEAFTKIVPAISGISMKTNFSTQAWCCSVVTWCLTPIAITFVIKEKSLWSPDLSRLSRQPWLIIFAVIVFCGVSFGMIRYQPDANGMVGYGFSNRMLRAMVSGRVSYSLIQAFICSGVSLCVGFLFRVPLIVRDLFVYRASR